MIVRWIDSFHSKDLIAGLFQPCGWITRKPFGNKTSRNNRLLSCDENISSLIRTSINVILFNLIYSISKYETTKGGDHRTLVCVSVSQWNPWRYTPCHLWWSHAVCWSTKSNTVRWLPRVEAQTSYSRVSSIRRSVVPIRSMWKRRKTSSFSISSRCCNSSSSREFYYRLDMW